MTVIEDYIIPSGVTADADYNVLRLGSRSIVAILWPAALTNTSVTFKAAYFAGEFPPLAMGGVATVFTAVPGDIETFSIAQILGFRMLRSLIITTGGAEASDRLFRVITRSVG